MNKTNPLTQKVNFFVSATFIAVFGVFFTSKIMDAAQLVNPIKGVVVATQNALEQN